jgi:hypothetical protein
MAKRRKARTFRKKMKGGLKTKQKLTYPVLPIDISETTYKSKIGKSPLGEETTYGETFPGVDISKYNRPLPDKPTLKEVDNTLTEEDLRGGLRLFSDKLKPQKIFKISDEYNENMNKTLPNKIYTEEEYKKFRKNPNNYLSTKPVDNIVIGGKLRRTRKQRMTKRRKSVKKMIRKSKKMRGGVLADYLPNFLTGKKPQQQNYNMMSELNSSFGNQPDEQEINRIKEINDKTVYDNMTELSSEYEQQMKENMEKYYDLQKKQQKKQQ